MMDFKKILEDEWQHLLMGTKSAKHPFHHFVLSNCINNYPNSRTIILRNVIEKRRMIGFNTDKRSPKYPALLSNNIVSVVFYDQERKVQLRIMGKIQSNNPTNIRNIWDNMALESKLCYMGDFAPSTIINQYKPNIPLRKITEIPNSEYELGYNNFINMLIKINCIDWLYLHSSGHKRIQYKWKNNESIINWVAT